MRKGRLSEASKCCRQALSLNPCLVDAHSNLGNLMKAQGLVQEAYNCYVDALRIQPTFAIAWSNLAGLFMEAGDLNKALQYYKDPVIRGNLLLTYTTGYVAPLLLAASFAGALQSLLSFRKFSAWINPMSGALLLEDMLKDTAAYYSRKASN